MRLTKKQCARLEALSQHGKVMAVESPGYVRLHDVGLVAFTALRPSGVLIELTLAGRSAL